MMGPKERDHHPRELSLSCMKTIHRMRFIIP